ncbi:hypothetical protein ACFL6S_04095 [Candidatus Poribacteria bacterium]
MKKLIYYAVGILVIMSGCALWSVKYPLGSKGEIIFSHKQHIEMEAECEMCHTEAAESEISSRNNYPKEADCMECHEREECSLCHTDVDNAIHLAPAPTGFIFSHKAHLESRVESKRPARRERAETINKVIPFVKAGSVELQIDCLTCHESVKESTEVADKHIPDMKTCRKCHEITEESCVLCHSDLGERDFVPASHYFTWVRTHQQMAASEGESLCGNCHNGEVRPLSAVVEVTEEHVREEDTRVCADCHRGDVWPEGIHDNNRLQSHSIDAIANQNTCNSCHERAECLACHQQRGISFVNIHEAGWAFDHADKARRRLGSCAVCHEEDDCLGCHQAISPHGSDWDRERPGSDETPCSKCHTE